MKKTSKLILVLLIVCAAFTLTACGKEEVENKTVATVLTKQFKTEIASNGPLETLQKLSENEVLDLMTDVSALDEKESVSGFKTEIKGYKNAYVIRPIIGSIPFIAYIFETESPKEFEATLKENADLRWNVCTEADNMETAVVDNYVFFVMAPKSFEE